MKDGTSPNMGDVPSIFFFYKNSNTRTKNIIISYIS